MSKMTTGFIIAFIAWLSFIPEPLQYNYGPLVKCVLAAFLFLSLCRSRFAIRKYFFAKIDIILWLYLLLISLNAWSALDTRLAWDSYQDLSLSSALVYFLIKNDLGEDNRVTVLYGLCVCAGIVCLLGFMEMLFGVNIIYLKFVPSFCYLRFITEGRMMSTLMHPSVLGAYLIACVPLAYYFYRKSNFPKARGINLTILLLIVSAIIMTGSRATLAAFLLVLTVWLLLRHKLRLAVSIWITALLFSFVAWRYPWHGGTMWRFAWPTLVYSLFHGHRAVHYFVTVNMLSQHPFLGIGLGHYRMLFDQYTNVRMAYEVRVPESAYLMHLAETGLIGFAGFALFLTVILKRAVILYRGLQQEKKDLFLAILIGFMGLLVNIGSFDGFLWKTPLYLFWIFAGIIAGWQERPPQVNRSFTRKK